MDLSKNVLGYGSKSSVIVKSESQSWCDGVDPIVNTVSSDSLTNAIEMSDSDMSSAPVQEGTQRRGPGRPRKEIMSTVAKKIGQRQKVKKTQCSPSVGESLSEFTGGDLSEVPTPMEVVFGSKDVDVDAVKSEVLLGDLAGSNSPRVSSSFTPKHDMNFDISFTDTGDSSSRTSLTISAEKMASEDSVASEETSSSGTIDKVCAFCNRGEKSLLGQGELTRYESTSGFNPFKKQLSRSKRTSFDPDEGVGKKGSPHLTWRRSKGASKHISAEKNKVASNSQLQSSDGPSLPITVDELSLVGYSEDTDVAQVFEKTGHIWAHHCCAAWSEGVIQSEDFSLHFVDKAVFSGLSQKCSYCCHYGATIKCRDSRCSKKYHYPCASGGGCFQDIKTLSLLCPDHTDQAVAIANQEAFCVVCETPGSISDQLFCTSCGQHYHGSCLDPTVEVNPVVRAGWQCPECKICQTCRQPGDDNKMLVCDTCDKGYHTFCLQPAMTTIPKNGWKCKNCRICGDCGSRTPGSGNSSRWHLNYSVCDSCYQQRNKGLCCPLCGKAYRQFSQNKMVPCCLCKRYVHAECDESLDASKIDQDDYVCLACKNRDTAGFEIGSQTDSLSSIVDETGLQDIENFSIFKGLKEGELDPSHEQGFEGDDLIQNSQDLMMADESLPCSEIDLNAINKVVQQLDTPSAALQSNSMSEINNGSDVSLASESKPSLVGNGSALPRPIGPGMGKPMFSEQYEKKLSAGRNKNRSVGIGKKKRMTSNPPANGKRGPKPKLKQMGSSQSGNSTDQGSKDDDHSSTVVLCSAKDHFTLKQDMCLSCGSYGKGEEGKLIACVQCGQCYHPYCVNLKVSVAMLQKGWRCLDCTVCEGCGKPHDESRLILCDECDISYHIYCLDPPLDSVPQGSWKCKWCIVCTTCGANTPGVGCQWRDNYSQCGPCASLEICPFCNVGYIEGDLIIQCTHCTRWVHAFCDGLRNEDDIEAALDYGYHCMLCRPATGVLGPLRPPSPDKPESVPSGLSTPLPPSMVAQQQAPPKEEPLKVPKTFFLDGVCLSEAGINLIRNQSLKIQEKKRPRWRRGGGPTHPALVPMLSISSEKSEDDVDNDSKSMAVDPIDGDECKVEIPHDDWEMTSPTYDKPLEPGIGLGLALEKKKKPRNRMGMGIGGFLPRHRTRGGGMVRSRIGSGLSKPFGPGDVSFSQTGMPGSDLGREDDECRVDADGKKPKRRPRKAVKKSHLEDSYPTCLQEAFFGRILLDKCKTSGPDDFEQMSDDDKDDFTQLSNPVTSKDGAKSSKDPFEFSDSPPLGDRAPGGGYRGDSHGGGDVPWLMPQQPTQSHQLPMVTASSETSLKLSQPELTSQQHDNDSDKDIGDALIDLPEVPLDVDDILIVSCLGDIPAQSDHSPMLDPTIDELAQIDNETLEDILRNGLSVDQHSDNSPTTHGDGNFTLGAMPGTSLQNASRGGMLVKDPLQAQNDDLFGRQNSPSSSISPFSPTLGADDFAGLEFPEPPSWVSGSHFDPHHPNLSSSQMLPSTSLDDSETNENLSYNQRNVKKWKKDEPLGDLSTISPVLYANLCHPDLKTKFPEWTERAKHISKLWRKVPAEDRASFLAKAKENRAASRLQRQQKLTQEAKRKQKDTASSSGGGSVGLGSFSGIPMSSTPQTPDALSQDQPDASSGVNLGQPHLPSQPPSLSEDRNQAESGPYSFIAHSSSSHSSPSGGYGLQHPAGAIFKQPHPPSQSFDQLTPGTPRQSTEMFMSHHPLHQASVGGAVDPYVRPPLTPGASPGELSPGLFLRHAGNVRPPPGGPHVPNLGGFKQSPTAEGYGSRMFAPSPFPPSSRLPDQFGYGDLLLRGSDRFQSPPGSMAAHSGEQFVGSASGLPQSHEVEHSASKSQKHPDGHKQVPPMLQRSVSDPFGQPMLPRSDAYSHSPMTPRPTHDMYGHAPMTPRPSSDSYGHGPVNPRSSMADPYAQPPSTPKPPVADHYVQPAITPKPVINDSYARANPDPYAQPPMTPRPGNDSYGQGLSSRPNPDPYSQPVATPRPNTDPYAQPPMTPRPAQDPYSQPPMTPRPAQDPYAQPPMTPRPAQDPYAQPPMTPRPAQDPYAQPPMTPRPAQDPYAQPPMTPRPTQDPYAQPPMTPRPNPDPYAQPPMTPRSNQDMYGQPPMTPRPSHDPYSQPPMTPRSGSDPYGQPVMVPRLPTDPYCQPPLSQRPNPDPYSQPPMTPRPSSEQFGHPLTPRAQADTYGQLPSRPGADQFGQPMLSVRPVITESFVHRALTPRASTTDAFGMVPHRSSLPDPYAHPPMTPRPPGPDSYGQIGMRPPFSEPYMQPRSLRPVIPPGVAAAADPYAQPPSTPQLMTRTHPSEEYSSTTGGSGISPVVSSQVTAGSEMFPVTSRTVTSEPYKMPPSGVEQYSSPLQQPQGAARPPAELPVADVSTMKVLMNDEAEVANSSMLDGEQQKQDVQRHQLRELLAKQSKQRQKQKKQDEHKRIQQEQSPVGPAPGTLRHWPEDPSNISFQAGAAGFAPYDGVQRPIGAEMINNPNVGIRSPLEMDRWPKEPIIRMPHPGQMRPRLEVEQFGLRDGSDEMMHQRFSLAARGSGMRPTLAGNVPYPSMPYQQQQQSPQQQQQDMFSMQHHQAGFKGPSERFRRSASVSGEAGLGPKLQPPMSPMSHRPTTPLPGQEGIAFGFQSGRMPHHGSVIPGLTRMPGGNSYESMIRGQAVPRIGSIPQHMMRPWPPQQRNLPMDASYGMMHPGGMIGGMRPMYSDPNEGTTGAGHLQHPSQMGQGVPSQNFVTAIHPSIMNQAQQQQQQQQPIGHPHPEIDKTADQFEDILGTADDGFSLLEYADTDLDSTLTEQHDKSIFDEHLGITSKSSTVSNAETAPAAKSQAQSVFDPEPKMNLIESGGTENSGLSSVNQSAVVSRTEVPAASQMKLGKPEFSNSTSVSETPSVNSEKSSGEQTPPLDGKNSELPLGKPTDSTKLGTNFQAKFVEYSKRQPAEGVQSAENNEAKGGEIPKEKQEVAASEPVSDTPLTHLPPVTPAAGTEQEPTQQVAPEPSGETKDESPKEPTSMPMQVDGCADFSSGDEMGDNEEPASSFSHMPNFYDIQNYRAAYNIIVDVDEPELVHIWEAVNPFMQVDGTVDDEEESKIEANADSHQAVEETPPFSGPAAVAASAASEHLEPVKSNEEVEKDSPCVPNSEVTASDVLISVPAECQPSAPAESKIECSSATEVAPPSTAGDPLTATSSSPPGSGQSCDQLAPGLSTHGTEAFADSASSFTVTSAANFTAPISSINPSEPNGSEFMESDVVGTVDQSLSSTGNINLHDVTMESAVLNQSGRIQPATTAATEGLPNQDSNLPPENKLSHHFPHHLMHLPSGPGIIRTNLPQQQPTGVSDHHSRGLVQSQLHQPSSGDLGQRRQYLYHQQLLQSPSGHPYPMHLDQMNRGLMSVQRFPGPPAGPPPPYPNQAIPINPMQMQRIRQQQQEYQQRQMSPRIGFGYMPFQGHEQGYVGAYVPTGQMSHPVVNQARSPHPAQSPHNLQSPIGHGAGNHQEVSPAEVPHSVAALHAGVSPRAAQSPVAWPGSVSGQSPLGTGSGGVNVMQQPLASPRTVAASPHLSSPHQRSRSGTPQMMSPASLHQLPSSASKPGTPQANLTNNLQQGLSSGHNSMPGTPSGCISQTPPSLSATGPPVGAQMTGPAEATMMLGHPDVDPTSAPVLQADTSPACMTLAHTPSDGSTFQASSYAGPVGASAQKVQQHQQVLPEVAPVTLSGDVAGLHSQLPLSSPVTHAPRPGSFVPRDPLGGIAHHMQSARPLLSQPGYPAGMKIMQHMMQPGMGQMPIGSMSRSDATAVATTSHSAIGALLNQQRSLGPAFGPNVGLMQHGLRPGPYGARPLGDPRYQPMLISAGPMQRQMLHPTLAQAPPGQPTSQAAQQYMMPSMSLLSPGNRAGIPNQTVLLHSSQPPNTSQSNQIDMMVSQRMPFSPHPFAAGPRNFGVAGQQQGVPGLHMMDLQQSAIIGLPGMSQQGPSSRPKRLEEQPLLLEDLLEQEKREQQRQAEQQLQNQHSQSLQDAPHLPSSSSGIAISLSSALSPAAAATVVSNAPSAPDSSAILTDADVEKLVMPVDDMVVGFHPADGFPGHAQQPILQHQQIEQALQQTSDHGWVGLTDPAVHLFPPRPVASQLGPRMAAFMGPLQQQGLASGLCGPQMIGSAITYPLIPMAIQPAPARPPDPPSDIQTEEDQQMKVKFEEWLIQFEHWISAQIGNLEAQIGKYRKTKKALNAKLRVAKKNSSNLSESDQQQLQTTTHEQSNLQKQLDQMRKQLRTHKNLVSEHRAKQPDSIPGPWTPIPGHMDVGIPFATRPIMPSRQSPSSSAVPVPVGSAPRLPVPRMPGATPAARLPPEVRQEYEAYVQSRIRMRQVHPPRAVIVQGDENNPFSESYQQREHLEKLRQHQEHLQVEQQQQQQQRRPLPPEDQGCLEATAGHTYGDQGQLMLQKQFLRFPQDGPSRLPGPARFPVDQAATLFGPSVHANFSVDLPVRMFSPPSGSESSLPTIPSGHSSPGLSSTSSHLGLSQGSFSPQVKAEHPMRKASVGSASTALQQMQQGSSSSSHSAGMGLFSCPNSESLLPSTSGSHISSASVITGATMPEHQPHPLKVQPHLTFTQSPTDHSYTPQPQTPVSASRGVPPPHPLASPVAQSPVTYAGQSLSSLDVSGGLMNLAPEQLEGLPQTPYAAALAVKPKKKRQRRKKADPAVLDDAELGCGGSDLDFNSHVLMAAAAAAPLPTEFALGSPSGNGGIGIPRYGLRPADCHPRFVLTSNDLASGKMAPPLIDLYQQQRLQMVSPALRGPRLQMATGSSGTVGGVSDQQALVYRMPLQPYRSAAQDPGGHDSVHAVGLMPTLASHAAENYGIQMSLPYSSTIGANQTKGVNSLSTSLTDPAAAEKQISQLNLGRPMLGRNDFKVDVCENEDADGKVNRQNILIKKLLKPNVPTELTSGANRLSEDEESIQLTPEQQLQLDLIERMPYTIEKPDQDDLDSKSAEEKEMNKRELELRLKMAELQPKVTKPRPRPKVTKQDGTEGERVVKKRKKSTLSSNVDPVMAMIHQQQQQQQQQQLQQQQQQQQLQQQPLSGKVIEKVDYGAISEQLMQLLHQMPPISLQEPEVKINYAVWPMLGTSLFSDGGSSTTELQGNYGSACIDAFMDYYNIAPFMCKSLAAPVAIRGSKPGGGVTGENQSPRAATEFVSESFHPAGIDSSGAFNKGPTILDMESRLQARQSLTDDTVPTIGNANNSGLSLVSSILNEQQSRPHIAERLKFPTPPLIEPHFDALSRKSDQSPLTIISSSSPELNLDENSSSIENRFLKLICADKRTENCTSPDIPIACPLPLKVVNRNDVRQQYSEKIIENNKDHVTVGKDFDSLSLKGLKAYLPSKRSQEQNQVSVKLTLSPNAAENISGVIAAIADLLRIAVPPSYEISRSPSPTSDVYRSSVMSRPKLKEEAVNIQSLMLSKQKLCHGCESVVLGSGLRKKKSELPSLKNDHQIDFKELDEVVFCDVNCVTQYESQYKKSALSNFIAGSESQLQTESTAAPDRDQASSGANTKVKIKTEYDAKTQDITADTATNFTSQTLGNEYTTKLIETGPVLRSPVLPSLEVSNRLPGLVEEKRKRKTDDRGGDDDSSKITSKKPKMTLFKRWTKTVIKQEIISTPTETELNEIMEKKSTAIRPKGRLEDTRKCMLCHEVGDAGNNGPGRLLIMDADKWVHLNCALWSYEVYETMNGALVNVDQAYKRGLALECVVCHKNGATLSCFRQRCTNIYHVHCAQTDGAMFFLDKTIMCSVHAPKIDPGNVMSSITVLRRVYVNRDENKQIARVIHLEERKCILRIGGLIIHNLGQLLPHQIHNGLFNTADSIYPVGFKSTRYYWSYRQINKRCRYVCKIEDQNGRPMFVVTVLEKGMNQVVLKNSSCKEVWEQALMPLEEMRRENDLVKIFPSYLTGEDLFGLTEPAVLKIIESLPGIEMLSGYNFRYGKSAIYKLPLAVNPSGCARTEPKLRTHFKKPHTLHGGSNSRSLPSTVTVMPGDVNSPYLKQFVHSKSQQYRRLKTEWRNNVYLRRSNIQGLGLFAARELEKHTMVIEYIGQLIRSEVAEKREKLYEKTNHGVYMFRIDDNCVVDATMSGGPARYVNHSCNPNCVAEVVPFEKDSKIIIITKRKISQGEELSYDYKFDFEDDQHKIPCLCGAANCRKWMN